MKYQYFTKSGQDAFYTDGNKNVRPYLARRNEKGEWLLVLMDGVTPIDKNCAEHVDKDWDSYVAQGDWVEAKLVIGFEYLKVEVSRTEVTDLYLKVPKGWKPTGPNTKILGQAAKETTTDSDWDNYGWEDTVEFQAFGPVDEKEAKLYKIFEVKG